MRRRRFKLWLWLWFSFFCCFLGRFRLPRHFWSPKRTTKGERRKERSKKKQRWLIFSVFERNTTETGRESFRSERRKQGLLFSVLSSLMIFLFFWLLQLISFFSILLSFFCLSHASLHLSLLSHFSRACSCSFLALSLVSFLLAFKLFFLFLSCILMRTAAFNPFSPYHELCSLFPSSRCHLPSPDLRCLLDHAVLFFAFVLIFFFPAPLLSVHSVFSGFFLSTLFFLLTAPPL